MVGGAFVGIACMELRQLIVFVAIADERHFGHAAARLGLAQPAVSRSIARLEAAIGTRLVERRSGQVGLTPAGEELLPHARTVVQAWEQAADVATRLVAKD